MRVEQQRRRAIASSLAGRFARWRGYALLLRADVRAASTIAAAARGRISRKRTERLRRERALVEAKILAHVLRTTGHLGKAVLIEWLAAARRVREVKRQCKRAWAKDEQRCLSHWKALVDDSMGRKHAAAARIQVGDTLL